MKNLKSMFLLLSLVICGNVFANPISNAITGTAGIVSSPIFLSIAVVECAAGLESDDVCGVVGTAATSSTPFLTSSLLLLKQEVKEVETDAYAFLAGESMTDALREVIESVRERDSILAQAEDKDVVAVLVKVLSI